MPAASRSNSRSKQQRIVVNCGMPGTGTRELAAGRARHRGAFHRHVQRHLVVPVSAIGRRSAGCSACPIVDGPANVPVARETEDGGDRAARRPRRLRGRASASSMSASIAVSRTATGSTARISFLPAKGNALPEDAADQFAVRFHLHPAIRANRLTDGHGVVLLLPNKDVWNFHAHEDEVVTRGKRLSRRPRRSAPHHPDRHLRPRARDPPRALDLQPRAAPRAGRQAPARPRAGAAAVTICASPYQRDG